MKFKILLAISLIILMVCVESQEKLGPIDYVIIFDEYTSYTWNNNYKKFRDELRIMFRVNKPLPGEKKVADDDSSEDIICALHVPETYNTLTGGDPHCSGNYGGDKQIDHFQRAFKFSTKIFKQRNREHAPDFIFFYTDGRYGKYGTQLKDTKKSLEKQHPGIKIFVIYGDDEEISKADESVMEQFVTDLRYEFVDTMFRERFRKAICDQPLACEPDSDNQNWKCIRKVPVGGCFEPKCEESECECDEMYPWEDECPGTCGYGVKKREILDNSECYKEQACKKDSVECQGKFGLVDLVVIFDESSSFYNWHEAKKHLFKMSYVKMKHLVLNNFEIGWNKTRVAFICSGKPTEEILLFHSDTNADVVNEKLDCNPEFSDSKPENLHESLKKASELLTGLDSRMEMTKVVLVFTDGHLEDSEKDYPKEAEILRNDDKLFFFYLNEDKGREELAKLTGNETNVILLNPDTQEEATTKFRETMCERDMFSKKRCKAAPKNENYKCQRNLVAGCDANNATVIECKEKFCQCEEMYPDWGPCSVTCGDGVKKRKVLNTSECETESDCHFDPCPTTQIQIREEMDIAVILDESKSFKDWHFENKKTVLGAYRKMMNFIANTFEIGWEMVRVAVYCTGEDGNLVFTFNDTRSKTADDDIREQTCKVDQDYPDNMQIVLNKAADMLSGNDSRMNTEKVIYVFTDGRLTKNETVFSDKVQKIQNESNLFFFFLADVNDSSTEEMQKIIKDESNVISFDVNKIKNLTEDFRADVCGVHLTSNETCEATPENETVKCQRNVTEFYSGCYGDNQFIECDEIFCDCDSMYPWGEDDKKCSVSCGDGEMKKKNVPPMKSHCPDAAPCYNGPCTNATTTTTTATSTSTTTTSTTSTPRVVTTTRKVSVIPEKLDSGSKLSPGFMFIACTNVAISIYVMRFF